MHARIISASIVVCLTAPAAAEDGADWGTMPSYTPGERATAEKKDQEAGGVVIPSTVPSFSPTTSAILSAGFALKSKEKLTTLTVAPFKLSARALPLWGLQFTAANDSGSGLSTFGVAYRAEWRWLFPCWHASSFAQAYGEASAKVANGSEKAIEPAIFRELDWKLINLIPVLSVGANLGVFPVDLEKENNHAVAEQNLSVQLGWHLGPYLQADAAATMGRKRLAVDQEKVAGTRGASATLVYLAPWLLGLTYYDDGYRESANPSLFQRGIGLGVTVEYKVCTEDGDDRALCPDAILKSLLLGVVIDLKVAKDIAPRFIVGRRTFTKFVAATEEKEAALEAGVVLAFTIKN